jgi:hypothetical protein
MRTQLLCAYTKSDKPIALRGPPGSCRRRRPEPNL